MALSVCDEIHRRLVGFLQPALAMIQRATSSPSRPASVAIISSAMSPRFISPCTTRNCRPVCDELHLLREHGQVGHIPFFPLFFVNIRVGQRDQMPQGPRHDVAVALKIALAAAFAAQHTRQLPSDGRLYGQNQ